MTGSLGSSLIITCKYPKESENNCKSFCKGRRGECASKISGRTRNQWERRGRFSLYNNSTGRFFMVTIDQLRPEDAGTYRCSDAGDDAEVSLRVMEGESSSTDGG
uniref:Ig-like domain-containing protein n=1 Tax=Denticeps clupeoides TaxID=299321 RepID=A0AAY3ZVV4_9TELE